MKTLGANVEPTEEQKDAIFEFMDEFEDLPEDQLERLLKEKFPQNVIDWFTETMLSLLTPEQ